jgi:hypothetical protein
MDGLLEFLYGGLVAMCLAIAMFFLRYWYLQRDRFFAWFSAAFLAFATSWGIHLVYAASDLGPQAYMCRLAGFVCIIAGIADKNRRSPG